MKASPQLLALTMGQGLAVGLVFGLAYLASAGSLVPQLAWILLLAALVAAAIGGVASFFHMHHFSAARYILRRLRSSWLSREALTTGLFGAALFLWALWTYFTHPALSGGAFLAAAWIVAFLGLLALFVTAMLYATIPAMMSWHSPVTVLNFMGVGFLGGASWTLVFAGFYRRPLSLAIVLLVLVGVSAVVKGLQWQLFRTARGRVKAATGFGLPRAPYRLQDTGTTKPPYRTQTQIYPELRTGERRGLQAATVVLLWGVPAVAAGVWLAGGGEMFTLVGAMAVTVGTGLERVLFFRDATHSSRVFLADEPEMPSSVAEPMTRSRAFGRSTSP